MAKVTEQKSGVVPGAVDVSRDTTVEKKRGAAAGALARRKQAGARGKKAAAAKGKRGPAKKLPGRRRGPAKRA